MSLNLRVSEAVEAAMGRLEKYTTRDAEFEERFGRWRRPDFLARYKLMELAPLIRYSAIDKELIDAAPFVKALRSEDRYLAAQIALFEYEPIKGLPATDKTLNTFKLAYLRRLEACGY